MRTRKVPEEWGVVEEFDRRRVALRGGGRGGGEGAGGVGQEEGGVVVEKEQKERGLMLEGKEERGRILIELWGFSRLMKLNTPPASLIPSAVVNRLKVL